MSASRTGVYLEDCVDDIASLPAELQRLLSTMRELDERSQNLQKQIEEDLLQCLNLPSTFAEPGKDEKEVNELRSEIATKQEQHLGLCTEKVLLARQAYDLVDSHEKRVSADVAQFESDLQQEGKLPPSAHPLGMTEKRKMPPPAFGAPSKRRDGGGGNFKAAKGEGGTAAMARVRERGLEGGFGRVAEGISLGTTSNPSIKRRSLGSSLLVNVDPPYRE